MRESEQNRRVRQTLEREARAMDTRLVDEIVDELVRYHRYSEEWAQEATEEFLRDNDPREVDPRRIAEEVAENARRNGR